MRSAEFDREQVLKAAMNVFMAKGYNKTSMQDLKRATGLHPGSLYCAFENKRGLLIAALAQYNQERSAEFQRFFSAENSPKHGLGLYLGHLVEECISNEPQKACLAQKALSELAEQDDDAQQFITHQLNNWQQGFIDIFVRAEQAQELNGNRNAEQRSQSLVMGIYGLRTYAHTHPKPEVLKALADQLLTDVCS